ncbi:MAG: ATP-binding cassette domain-containing protein [Nitrospirales bacterium]|nr:ATP-binding cassette domain-containing protein [Nitrospirales bacterium]
MRRTLSTIRVVHALKEISFDFKPGDSVGLIGNNGAGKSTLLKLMAGVLEPVRGKISRCGQITSLLTFGSGMQPQLDGYQNIRRMGLLRGFSIREVKDMTPEIVEFAQLGDFITLPLRTYSTGMRMRLAFAIATVGTPDILLVDEVFGAGDNLFIKRAKERISKLLYRSKIVVLSSHSESIIREFCATCLYLDSGQIRAYGETEEILSLYAADIKEGRNSTKPQGLSLKTIG